MPSLLVGRSKRLNGVSDIETGVQVHQATERKRVQRLMFEIVIRVGSFSYFSYGGSFKLRLAGNLLTYSASDLTAEGSFVDCRLPQTLLGHSSLLDGTRCFFGSKMKRKINFPFAFCSLIRTFAAKFLIHIQKRAR